MDLYRFTEFSSYKATVLELLSICTSSSYISFHCNPRHSPLRIPVASEKIDKYVRIEYHVENYKKRKEKNVYRHYIYEEKKDNLPCVFHSDVSIDETGNVADNISSPEAIYKAAKVYPEVPVVMAHMGAGNAKSHQNAIEVLLKSIDNNDAKLYVDLSWVDWGANGLSSSEQPSVVTLINVKEHMV